MGLEAARSPWRPGATALPLPRHWQPGRGTHKQTAGRRARLGHCAQEAPGGVGSALLVQAPLPRLAPEASPALPCHGVSHSTTPSGRGWPSSAPCVTSEQGRSHSRRNLTHTSCQGPAPSHSSPPQNEDAPLHPGCGCVALAGPTVPGPTVPSCGCGPPGANAQAAPRLGTAVRPSSTSTILGRSLLHSQSA